MPFLMLGQAAGKMAIPRWQKGYRLWLVGVDIAWSDQLCCRELDDVSSKLCFIKARSTFKVLLLLHTWEIAIAFDSLAQLLTSFFKLIYCRFEKKDVITCIFFMDCNVMKPLPEFTVIANRSKFECFDFFFCVAQTASSS
jgi:hypothetical protein